MSGNLAHIIKPAVAILKQTETLGTNGGAGTQYAYVKRTLNTFEGETWFVTPYSGTLGPGGTNTDFTLESGTYELQWSGTHYSCDYTKTALYDETNSSFIKWSDTGYSASTANSENQVNGSMLLTITAATRYSMKTIISGTGGTGDFGLGSASTGFTGNETFLELLVRKLK